MRLYSKFLYFLLNRHQPILYLKFHSSNMNQSATSGIPKRHLANLVIDKYKNQFDKDSNLTWQFFKELNIPKATVYRYIKKYGDCNEIIFNRPTGRPVKIATPEVIKKVKNIFDKKPDTTIAAASRKLNIKKSYLHHIKVKKLGYKARTKKKAASLTEAQKIKCNNRIPNLAKKILRKVVIMDDETYVFADPSQGATREFFHSSDPSLVDPVFKEKRKSANPKKFLIWQAIDQYGNISEPYVQQGTMNSQVYLEECIKKRLIPFIEKYHKTSQVIFWPDLATIHYAKSVMEFLEQNFSIVRKNENPPKTPQLRPIERFWALCKQRYSQLTGYFDTPRKIAFQWEKISSEVGKSSGKKLMKKFKKKVFYEAENGVKSSCYTKL